MRCVSGRSWLTGFQFLETLFVFVRSSKAWLVLTSAKKAEHLRQLETIKGLQIFVKDPQEGNRQNLVQMATAMRTAIGKDVDVSRWRQVETSLALKWVWVLSVHDGGPLNDLFCFCGLDLRKMFA